MQKECEYVVIDNKNYIILDEINNYVFLGEASDARNFFIRKSIKDENGETLINLENEAEFNFASKLFLDKHNNEK